MTISTSIRSALVAAVLCGLLTIPAHSTTYAERTGVITIYNKTPIRLPYQLRVKVEGSNEWSEWESHDHKYPHGGWQYHFFDDVENIQIRFDRIGGDGKITEQVYDLDFNSIVPYEERACRHKGRAYKFQFDNGGQLLDLYHYRNCR